MKKFKRKLRKMKKLSSKLFNLNRKIGKAASFLLDIETLATGNPELIAKRVIRKNINKTSRKITRQINKRFR